MISVLIPFFDTSQYRRRNLTAVVENYKENYPHFEVMIAEQNASDFACTLVGDNVEHVDIKIDSDHFNKSHVINTAIRDHVKSPLIMMSDADCILPKIDDRVFIEGLTKGSVFFPFSEVNFLNEAHTRSWVRKGTFTQVKQKQDLFINRYTGLVNVFTKATFAQVGGFDPEFVSWGGEDDAFIEKCKRIVSPVYRNEIETTLLHLYHPKANTSEYSKSECFTWNKKRVATIRRMSDEELMDYVIRLQRGDKAPLQRKLDEYDQAGKLEFNANLPLGTGGIVIDTTVYNIIPKDGQIDLREILQCIYDTDGAGFLGHIIGLIDERINDMSPEENSIVEHFRLLV